MWLVVKVLSALFVALVAVVVGILLSYEAPAWAGERAAAMRNNHLFAEAVYYTGFALEFIGLSTRASFIRFMKDYLGRRPLTQLDGIEYSNTHFAGVPVAIYKPRCGQEPSPAVIYIHGGGWIFGSVALYHDFTAHLAKDVNVQVISVEYRLAPENPFPAGFDDCLAVVKHVFIEHQALDINFDRIMIAGDSAGGNLAAAVTVALAPERHLYPLHHQFLISPVLQLVNFQLPSYKLEGVILQASMHVPFYVHSYFGGLTDTTAWLAYVENRHLPFSTRLAHFKHVDHSLLPGELIPEEYIAPDLAAEFEESLPPELVQFCVNPLVSPLLASDETLKSVPPAYIFAAEFDGVRDDAYLYHGRLQSLGMASKLTAGRNALHIAPVLNHLRGSTDSINEKAYEDLIEHIRRALL